MMPEQSPASDSVLDFVRLEVLRGRMQSIVDEAGAALLRTAFSMVVREARDFACAIMTPAGRTVVQSSQSVPVFLGTTTLTVREILQRFPLESWEPGDIVGTNDLWLGTGHYNDFTVLIPVFVDGAVVAFTAVTVHLPDIGGRILGSGSTQCFEEGLCIPPLKIGTARGLDKAVIAILEANVRLPGQVIGDLQAALNGGAVISRRLEGLCQEISVPRFYQVCHELDVRAERFMREAIARVPDGWYTRAIRSEPVGGVSFDIQLRIDVRGDELEVDFAGSSSQVAPGVNACFNYSRAYVLYALKCLLAPGLPLNEGLIQPIRVKAPDATVVNSRHPAAGSARNLVGHYIPTLIIDALAEALPHEVIAECAAPAPVLTISGAQIAGDSLFRLHALVPGGMGARATQDGLSAVGFPMNGSAIPVEVIEATCPLLFEERQLRRDSGGAGEFQGGLGQRSTIQCLSPWAQVTVSGQRLHQPPSGLFGGRPGATASVKVNDVEIADPSGGLNLSQGDRLTIESAGGGGYGDPRRRSAQAILRDVASGYLSVEAAAERYSVSPGAST